MRYSERYKIEDRNIMKIYLVLHIYTVFKMGRDNLFKYTLPRHILNYQKLVSEVKA